MDKIELEAVEKLLELSSIVAGIKAENKMLIEENKYLKEKLDAMLKEGEKND